jgi:hypothetical protein
VSVDATVFEDGGKQYLCITVSCKNSSTVWPGSLEDVFIPFKGAFEALSLASSPGALALSCG